MNKEERGDVDNPPQEEEDFDIRSPRQFDNTMAEEETMTGIGYGLKSPPQ